MAGLCFGRAGQKVFSRIRLFWIFFLLLFPAHGQASGTLYLEEVLERAAKASGKNLIVCSEARGVQVSLSLTGQCDEAFARVAAATAGFLLQEPLPGTWTLVPSGRALAIERGEPDQVRIYRITNGSAATLAKELGKLFPDFSLTAAAHGNSLILTAPPGVSLAPFEKAIDELDTRAQMVSVTLRALVVEKVQTMSALRISRIATLETVRSGGWLSLSGTSLLLRLSGSSESRSETSASTLVLAGAWGDLFWGRRIMATSGPLSPLLEIPVGIRFSLHPISIGADGVIDMEWTGILGTITSWRKSYPIVSQVQGNGRVLLRQGESRAVALLSCSGNSGLTQSLSSLQGSSPLWESPLWSRGNGPVVIFYLQAQVSAP